MKASLALIILSVGLIAPAFGQGFVNLNFESATVVPRDPTFGILDWNLAAPGWSHSGGSDTSIIYYGIEHLGLTQYYMLYSSLSPDYAPGTQLAGRYSLGFSSGYVTSAPNAPWSQAYLSQIGTIASGVQSLRFLARGSFDLFVGGVQIPVQAFGGNAYAGDISAFAGTSSEFKIINTSMLVHDPVVVDNIVFSTVAVPEPSTVALIGVGLLVLFLTRRKTRPAKQA